MAIGPELPSIWQIHEMAAHFGLKMSDEDAARFGSLMKGSIKSCKRLDELPEVKPDVKYPRVPGFRPEPSENPYNAWFWRTEIKGASNGILSGKKVGVKDSICVAGVPMMNGSRVLEGFIPDVDATVVTRLLDAGAVIAGKTNCEDCCYSGAGHTCSFGPVRNPHMPTHAPGGSSNGSAAAIAAGDVEMALGGDQGGSIRIPAAWSGVVGLKPTYGLVPYTGCTTMEMTLDHVGPMANNVENVARMLSAIAGPDPLDPRQRGTIPSDYVRDYMPAIGAGIKGLKIATIKEAFGLTGAEGLGLPGSEEIVDRKVRTAVTELEKLGAVVTEISFPMFYDGVHIWGVIALQGIAEFMLKGYGLGTNWTGFYNTALADGFARGWKSRPNDLPSNAKVVLLTGEYLHRYYHSRYYAKAQNLLAQLRKAYDRVFASYDLVVMPTVPFRATPLPPAGCSIEETWTYGENMIGNTCQFCATGHPSISVPCGIEDGLPIGMMITGRHFEDLVVLQAADAFEKIGDWRTM